MKIYLLLTLFTLVNAMGSVFPQSGGLTLSLNNATVLEVFNTIENQSKFKFFYQNEQIDVSRKVNIQVQQAKIEDVLNSIFAKENVKYRILEDNLIVLTSDNMQQVNITGTVTSATDGSPLLGVNVVEKNTTSGVITDADGKYSIPVQGENSVLIFSYVGYKTAEIALTGQSVVDVKLEEDISKLDEVVVIGYGVQKKSLVTGAISSVKAEDIENSSVTRAEQALQGRTSGVQILPTNGSPGSGINVRIRGYSSNGNSNPIFIVDGVKSQDIAFLDPNDIASMEVLKDAASSAIYGAEGGNGVIMITTKKGKVGKTQVTYEIQQAWQSAAKLPKLMNTAQYAQYMNEAGLITAADQTYNTDWLDEVFDAGTLTKHYLNFSGGNETSNFLVSLSYMNNNGIITGTKDKYKRYTIRLNSEHNMAKWLKVGNNFNYTNSSRNPIDERNGEFGGIIGSALQMDPTTPVEYTGAIPGAIQTIIDDHPTMVKAPSGNYYGKSQYVTGEIWNPFANMATTNEEIKRDNINGNVFAEITPIKNLTLTSRFGLDLYYDNDHYWTPTYYYSAERSNGTSMVFDLNDMYTTWIWENFASYNKQFNDINLSLMAGMSAEKSLHRVSNGQGGPMIVELPSYSYLDYIGSQGNDLVNNRLEDNRKVSYFGRASVDVKSKYLLQGSIRRDGAGLSQLPLEGRWGTFPSFSAGWVLSNEDFFPKTPAITNLKLRASWGQNGSLSNLNNYPYASSIIAVNGNMIMQYPLSDGTLYTIQEPGQSPNPSLKWETSQQTNIGIDLRALSDKLSFSVDYYKKTTKDLITNNSTAFEAGNYPSPINGGNVENSGFEFDLGFKNTVGDLRYAVNVNLSTLKNKVTYLNPNLTGIDGVQVGTGWNATRFEEGQPIWYFNGYKTNGIDKATGNPIYVTKNGRDTTVAGVTSSDMQFIGSPIPKILFGGNISIGYKNIDLSANFAGMAGNKVMLGWIRNDRNTVNRPTYFFDDRWTSSNQNGSKPAANADTKMWNSDQIVFDGSFLRIQQIQLSYSLPREIVKTIKLSSVKLFVSLDNYFLFTSYPGMDPQASPQNSQAARNTKSNFINQSNGIDRGTYPSPKSLMLGATVSF